MAVKTSQIMQTRQVMQQSQDQATSCQCQDWTTAALHPQQSERSPQRSMPTIPKLQTHSRSLKCLQNRKINPTITEVNRKRVRQVPLTELACKSAQQVRWIKGLQNRKAIQEITINPLPDQQGPPLHLTKQCVKSQTEGTGCLCIFRKCQEIPSVPWSLLVSHPANPLPLLCFCGQHSQNNLSANNAQKCLTFLFESWESCIVRLVMCGSMFSLHWLSVLIYLDSKKPTPQQNSCQSFCHFRCQCCVFVRTLLISTEHLWKDPTNGDFAQMNVIKSHWRTMQCAFQNHWKSVLDANHKPRC